MRRWIHNLIGRWKVNRYRTEQVDYLFRTYDENQAILENGGTLWGH